MQERWKRRLDAALTSNEITADDYALIEEYIEYKNVKTNIAPSRKKKITQHLITFEHEWSNTPYRELTPEKWLSTISHLISSPYAQNTKSDYIVVLKGFLHWGVKKKRLPLTIDDVDEVRIPKRQVVTKSPDELISVDEAYRMLLHPDTDAMMAALLAVLYFFGPRITEVLSLQWKDLIFRDMQLGMRINDTKTDKYRYASSCEALEFVSAWRSRYPDIDGGPNGENFVFISRGPKGKKVWQQLSYPNAAKRISLIGRNVLGRHIHAHLFRTSNITNLAKDGVPDSVNKEMHWGNQATQMLRSYCLLNNSQVDDAMYKHAGIQRDEERKAPKGPIQCVHCRTMNVENSSYCRYCGMPLTRSAKDKQTLLRDAAKRAKEELTFAELRKDTAAYLGVSEDELSEMLGL